MPDAIFTIGHSNRSAELFQQMLRDAGIQLLADVRAVPRSRFNPHFNDTRLKADLAALGIDYVHLPELGGKRAPAPASRNQAFRPEGGLQSYADYMATPEFHVAVAELIARGREKRTAMMCAEAKPEHCHRQLVADALLLAGVPVIHLAGPEETRPHALHPAARQDEAGQLYYPAEKQQLTMKL